MKAVGIALVAVLVVAAGVVFFRMTAVRGGESRVSAYLEDLAGKVAEIEDKINNLVAYQIKNSENSRQVYGAVARLCTIFEGILQINQKSAQAAAAEPAQRRER